MNAKRTKPEVSEAATQSDVDEMDEVWALQAIDILAENGNMAGLMRVRSRLEKAIKDAQMAKFADKTKNIRRKVGGLIGKAIKAREAIKKVGF